MQATTQDVASELNRQARDFAALMGVYLRDESAAWLQTVTDLDLTLSQLKALMLLDRAGEQSVKDLATGLKLSLPATSRAADQLVQRGLLDRRECATDRRSRLVRLSATGADAVRVLTSARIESVESFLRGLDPAHRDALHAAIRPILERSP